MNHRAASNAINAFTRFGKAGPNRRGRKATKFDIPKCAELLIERLSDPNKVGSTLKELQSQLAMGPPAGLGITPPPSAAAIARWLDNSLIAQPPIRGIFQE